MDAKINSYATRCFRDTADREYIHARLAYHSMLLPQFRWSALHSLEKYAKCILLLNRIDGRKIRHVVMETLSKASKHGRIKIELSQGSKDFISRLESSAASRYLESSWYTMAGDLQRLDCAVVEIRRYCQSLEFKVAKANGDKVDFFSHNLAQITPRLGDPLKNVPLSGGWLERVIEKPCHPARDGLVWGNPFFGTPAENEQCDWDYSGSEISPFDLHPDVIQELEKLIHIPKAQLNHIRTTAPKKI